MKKIPEYTEPLLNAIDKKKILTIDELKDILGTQSRMTVFRRLKKFNYITSYSHSGKFYSLKRTAKFNSFGLWFINSVLFSKHGTLIGSVKYFIDQSKGGHTASELEKYLKVKVDDVLFSLLKNQKIERKKILGIYVYFSKDNRTRKRQELFRKLDFSLRSNSKKISNGGRKLTKEEAEKRNKQFEFIKRIRKRFSKKKLPILSVDGKKKELIGNFKNSGTRYKKEADLTNDHDFAQYGIGKSFPYGLFDDERNEGFVYVGQALWDKKEKKFTSSETPEFAAECIVKWWKAYGRKRYPVADEILILADSGGSNGNKSRMWKAKLHELLCNKLGMKVTVCHYPPGASKWNPIEHRLFSEISKNWQGTPLKSFETVLKYIRTTETKTGLKVRAQLVKKKYKKGKTVPKECFEKIKLKPQKFMPSWNYSIVPTL